MRKLTTVTLLTLSGCAAPAADLVCYRGVEYIKYQDRVAVVMDLATAEPKQCFPQFQMINKSLNGFYRGPLK